MNDEEKEELIRNLSDSRENISQLLNMEKKEQWNLEQKVRLATEAKESINDALYKLTGNEFYNNNKEKKEWE